MSGVADKPKRPTGASDPLLAAVGERIRAAREAAGLAPVAGARAAGMTKGYLFRMETGQQNLTVRSLARVALAFDTTMSSLLEGVAAGHVKPGVRPYAWRDGADPRDPNRALGSRRQPKVPAAGSGEDPVDGQPDDEARSGPVPLRHPEDGRDG